jgi:hypothetical protein
LSGDDQIERSSDRFGRAKAENPFRARVPEGDDAAAIGSDDRVGRGRKQRVAKIRRGVHRIDVELLGGFYKSSAGNRGGLRRPSKPTAGVIHAVRCL